MVRLCGCYKLCVYVSMLRKKATWAQKRANTKRQATIHRARWMSNSHRTQFVASGMFCSSRIFHYHQFIYKCTQYSSGTAIAMILVCRQALSYTIIIMQWPFFVVAWLWLNKLDHISLYAINNNKIWLRPLQLTENFQRAYEQTVNIWHIVIIFECTQNVLRIWTIVR